MQIHVARQSVQLGVFTVEEVAAGLQSSRFLAADLGWREGMAGWTALGDWPEFRGVVPVAAPGLPPAASEPMPAWERGASVNSFFATIRDVALNPIRTFDALPQGDYAKPIRYAYATMLPLAVLLLLACGLVAAFVWPQFQQGLRNQPDAPAFLLHLGSGALFLVLFGGSLVFFALAPWIHFISSAFIHVLMLPWRPQGGYAQTYRASSYVLSAFTLPQMIPCVNYVAAVWQLVCLVIALARVHRLAWWKVVVSVIVVPFCCFCLLYGAMFSLLFAGSLA
jgi:hypothetical protein